VNRPNQQHFVTRAYLEGFLANGGTHLVVYTREKNDAFRALPKNVAKIHNYYSVKTEDGSYDDRVEHMLQTVIEDPGLSVIRKLNSGHYDISRYARIRLATLLAVQEYRVPWMREQMEAFTTGMLQRFTQSMLDAPGAAEATLDELGLSDKKETLAEMRKAFKDGNVFVTASPVASLHAMGYVLESLLDVYFKMGWEVLETDSISFITSDCPVHRYYLPIRNDIPYSGLLDKRVQVRFPLSAQKMLVMRHDRQRIERERFLRQHGREREAVKLMERASQIRHIRVGAHDVNQINAHTISMAARHVFSPIEMPEIPPLFRGECMNVRQVLTDYPGGFTEFKAHYPQHPSEK
jgi:hypothetical protein